MPDESSTAAPVAVARHRTPLAVRLAALAILLLVLPVLLLALVEGGASLLLFGYDAADVPAVGRAEDLHTRHDTLLGWVNRPGASVPDMYGPGISLRTNSAGFRGREPVTVARPDGRRRLVCSGDSFTLGYGVGDDQTWCAQLGRATGMQAVNMGQGGYGIDQAWLWYRRDGAPLQHDLHVLAFITDDFRRMRLKTFFGYARPRVRLARDSLALENVPVPEPGRGTTVRRYLPVLRTLRSWQFVERLTRKVRGGPDDVGEDALPVEEVEQVFSRIAADLVSLNAAKGSRFALVYLPMLADQREEWSAPWRRHVRAVADSLDVPFIDLVEELRALPPHERPRLFLAEGAVAFPGATGHLSVEGNTWVAERLHARLGTVIPWLPPAASIAAPLESTGRRADISGRSD